MSTTESPAERTRGLTPAERDWIRRQGLTARVLAAEQRRVRARMSDAAADAMRRRDEGRRRRFER
jgi:hypothetical protein